MALVCQVRASFGRTILGPLAISLISLAAPAQALGSDNGELIQLGGAGASSPYELLEESIEHVSCEGAVLTSCTSQILFVAEVPDSPPPPRGQRLKGATVKYTFSITNGGIEADQDIRIGTLPRNGVVCRETDFLEFSGDYTPSSPVVLSELFSGNVVIERLEPNASANLSFSCQVK